MNKKQRHKLLQNRRRELKGHRPKSYPAELLRSLLVGVHWSDFKKGNLFCAGGVCFRMRVGLFMTQPTLAIIAHQQFVCLLPFHARMKLEPVTLDTFRKLLRVLDPKEGRRAGISVAAYNAMVNDKWTIPPILLGNHLIIHETEPNTGGIAEPNAG